MQKILHIGGRTKTGLTLDWFDRQWELQGGLCYWLGIPMDITGKNPLSKVSIDRLAPGEDYTPENTVLATIFANIGRRDSSVELFVEFLSTFLTKR